MTLSVLQVASEAVPLIKTGGLADVVGALPNAVAPHGVAMTTLLPGYPKVMAAAGKLRTVRKYDHLFGAKARIGAAVLDDGMRLLVLDAPDLFARDGGPYSDAAGQDWPDNWRRFAALGRAAADLATGAGTVSGRGKGFDVLHAHDWQAAMAPTYLRYDAQADATGSARGPVPSVLTIHNIAFQGHYGAEVFGGLGLPASAWALDGVEFHRGVSLLKGGLVSCDAITTVSPSYAREIQTAEFGMGLEGVIRARANRVHGILNGIDRRDWHPRHDPALAARFGKQTIARRSANKRAIEQQFALEPGDGPLFVIISRLTWQKGTDVLLECIDHLVGLGGRLTVLGSGDRDLEQGLHAAAARHPGRVGVRIGYDEALSHLLQGGGDAILIPSRFEPCGLTQLYGLAYGCVPIVAATGGLADTVIDANPAALDQGVATGVVFSGLRYDTLAMAISRTVELHSQPARWQQIQRNGMTADFGWSRSGAAYAELYRQLARGSE